MGRTAAVAGASGYAGGELLRLLLGHPDFELGPLAAGAAAGSPVTDVHPQLPSLVDRVFVSTEAATGGATDGSAATGRAATSGSGSGSLTTRAATLGSGSGSGSGATMRAATFGSGSGSGVTTRVAMEEGRHSVVGDASPTVLEYVRAQTATIAPAIPARMLGEGDLAAHPLFAGGHAQVR